MSQGTAAAPSNATGPKGPNHRKDAPMRAKGPKRPNRQTMKNHI
jgi:hypothetical protein